LALRLVAALAELLGIFAVGIIGAGDERPELAAAQVEASIAALRADARVRTVRSRRVEPGRQEFVYRRGDLRRLLVHHLAGLGLEVAPEVIEQFMPVEPPARNVVELLLELGGVIVAHIFLEEAL